MERAADSAAQDEVASKRSKQANPRAFIIELGGFFLVLTFIDASDSRAQLRYFLNENWYPTKFLTQTLNPPIPQKFGLLIIFIVL